MHCVDLGESFPTSIWLQKSASIQPRTSPAKFARSPCADPLHVRDSLPCLFVLPDTSIVEGSRRKRQRRSTTRRCGSSRYRLLPAKRARAETRSVTRNKLHLLVSTTYKCSPQSPYPKQAIFVSKYYLLQRSKMHQRETSKFSFDPQV